MSEAETFVPDASKIGRLGELFLQRGLLTPEQIDQVAQLQKDKKLRFGDAALALGYLTQPQLDQALGEQFGFSGKELINGSADKSLKFFYFPFSKEAEEIRRLRSELLLKFSAQEKIKLALVSSAHQDGKSYMSASLAIALSQVGKRTLLIDADLRKGSLHEYFSLGKPDGLSSVLAGRIALADALIQLMPNLYLLPAGPRPPNPLEILRAPRIRELLESCSDQFDAFVIDTYTAANASDAQMVAHQTGSVLLVARKDHSYIDELRHTKADMQAAGVSVLGTIYNQYDDAASGSSFWLSRWFSRIFRRNK
ncbi:polysaccharide biosynthesis tyrosine autokinase [Undibacterium sp. TJN19]|uniref:polysaccharide biosynthesis tyrosine autokinase n=1 Tax=Undibacterium sp. TJN19 TaxID=3413055 RepID=UPI003BF1A5D8